MSLVFAGGTDKVSVAAASSINGLTTCTLVVWVYPTTLTNQIRIFQKGLNPSHKIIFLNGTGGNVEIDFGRGTSGAGNVGVYISNNTPMSSVNKWYFVAGVWDAGGGAGNIMHLYIGDLTTAPTEVTYGTKTDGVGSSPSDSSNNLIIGNHESSSLGWQGRIAPVLFWNRTLSLAEIRAQWARRCITSGCVLYHELGWNGTGTQMDWSGNGNSGTVTGATVGAHSPSGPQFGYDRPLMRGPILVGGRYLSLLGCGA